MDEERTEQASPRKREQARRRGEGPRSKELTDGFNLLAGLLALWLSISYGLTQSGYLLTDTLLNLGPREYDSGAIGGIFTYIVSRSLILCAPVMLMVLLITGLVNVLQAGFIFSGEKLQPNFGKLNPIKGFQRILSLKGAVETLKNIIKLIIVGAVLYTYLRDHWIELVSSVTLPPIGLVTLYSRMAFELGLRLVLFLLALAIADYFYQRWEFERGLRMTKQEVKEELKQYEGNPLIRQKIRQRAREIAMTRMLAEVPQADVVVTNPTHYAVALRYAEELGAPTVVAKGVDAVALRIRVIAQEHEVAIEESPELAQTLWKTVEVGEQIPVELYEVLAEILARVYAAKAQAAAA